MADTPTMFEEFSFTGHWWLPGDEENRRTGTLSYRPESGIELELLDAPDAPEKTYVFMGEVKEEPTLIMAVYNSLIGEQWRSTRQSFSENKRYRARFLLTGHWFHPEEITPVTLNSVSASFSSLKGWMYPESPFAKSFSGPVDKEITVSYIWDLVTVMKFPVSALKSELSLVLSAGENEGNAYEINLVGLAGIRIIPDRPQLLDWFREQIDSVRDLLTILTGLPIESQVTSGTLNDDGDRPRGVHIYYLVHPPALDDFDDLRIAFPFGHIKKEVGAIFNAWFELTEDAMVPFSLCLDVINNTHRFWRFEFLALVQALESHHRLYFEKEGKERQRYRHENGKVKRKGPDLIDRLKELREIVPSDLQEFESLTDEFLISVKDTRHYYTHYNSEYRDKAFKELELYDALARLVPFIAWFLYKKLRIPEEAICKAFAKTGYRGLWQRPILKTQEVT